MLGPPHVAVSANALWWWPLLENLDQTVRRSYPPVSRCGDLPLGLAANQTFFPRTVRADGTGVASCILFL